MEKMISKLDAFSDIIIQISKMPACTEELKHIASVIEQTRREMAMQENGTVNDTPISRPDQYLGPMQVDEDGNRFASSGSCHESRS